jgi:glycosyltransferase involved in cell wall biosynthesis
MNILWLAPIPFITDKSSHPAPWIITLAEELIKKKINLTIINYNDKILEPVKKINYNGINIIYVKTLNSKLDLLSLYFFRIRTMRKFLSKIIKNFDLLHIHGTEHQYEVMAHKLEIQKIISIQGIISECIKVLPKRVVNRYIQWFISSHYEKKYLPFYENFSCRTHWDTKIIQQNVKEPKIFKIWELIRNDFFEDNYNKIPEYLLFVGGKNPIKGLNNLLIAYNSSLQKLGFKIIILGNCTKTDLDKIIVRNKLTNINLDNIELKGMVSSKEMISAFKKSFCLIHPTFIDNSPNSICEAQLSGLPVIATNVGGVSSLIEDNITGILINTTPIEIENSVLKLLTNENLRENISKLSRESSRIRHNKETILTDTLNMYKTIINGDNN